MTAVHQVVERAPVGPLDRPDRTVGRDPEADQYGAEPVLRDPSSRRARFWSCTPAWALSMPRSAAASMILMLA
jgi:hypothetical protein